MSPLGGRLLLFDMHYATKDFCVRAVEVELHFVWWELTVKRDMSERALPFRVRITTSGMEYMMYNNSTKYDDMEQLEKVFKGELTFQEWKDAKRPQSDAPSSRNLNRNGKKSDQSVTQIDPSDSGTEDQSLKLPLFYRLCPITSIVVTKGAVYVGAPRLPNVMVVKFAKATIHHSAVECSEPNARAGDLYHSTTDMRFEAFKLHLLVNTMYAFY